MLPAVPALCHSRKTCIPGSHRPQGGRYPDSLSYRINSKSVACVSIAVPHRQLEINRNKGILDWF